MHPRQLAAWAGALLPASAALADPATFAREIEPILMDYCFDCHGDGAEKGDFALDAFESLSDHLADTALWMTVWENVRTEMMPPSEKKQPPAEARARLVRWIEQSVFKLDPENPDPGRVTVRRLNREEYQNTIRDIFGFSFNAREAFPPDDTGYGFDNIGDVLTLSPLLMEKYLGAARKIVAGVADTDGPIIPTTYLGADQFLSEDRDKANSIPFDRPGIFAKTFSTEHPGDYRVSLEYRIVGAEKDTAHTARLLLRINGKQVLKKFLAWGDTETVKLSASAPVARGGNRIEIELVQVDPAGEGETHLALQVQNLRLHGPLDGSHRVFPSSYNKIFVEGPPADGEHEAYFRRLIRHWGLRLWRRPVDRATEDRLVALAGELEGPNQRFEKAFAERVLTVMLVSPRFLFRAELQPEPDDPGKIVAIDEFALASRLSYFLWQSAPDARLLELAGQGALRSQLRDEVGRMIQDGKSERFVRSFTGQWLQTRDLDLLDIDPRRVLGIQDRKKAESYYNYRTRDAMRRETEMLFAHVLKEDRSVLDFLTAGYTFVNEDLARTYGIEGIKGSDMQRIDLPPGSPRGGILGQGTFLVVTSNPTRTSPVKRGLFVLENLLAAPAPPPPGEVPTVEEQRRKKENKNLTMRQLMEVHRQDKLCASCHARFDPIGIALENYNAIGMWREEEGGKPIEAGGKLITGEAFADARELSRILATERRGDFYRCLAEKLLTYATGRGVEYDDAPTIDRIVDRLEKSGGKMSALVLGVIESAPFQKRRGDGNRLP